MAYMHAVATGTTAGVEEEGFALFVPIEDNL